MAQLREKKRKAYPAKFITYFREFLSYSLFKVSLYTVLDVGGAGSNIIIMQMQSDHPVLQASACLITCLCQTHAIFTPICVKYREAMLLITTVWLQQCETKAV